MARDFEVGPGVRAFGQGFRGLGFRGGKIGEGFGGECRSQGRSQGFWARFLG